MGIGSEALAISQSMLLGKSACFIVATPYDLHMQACGKR